MSESAPAYRTLHLNISADVNSFEKELDAELQKVAKKKRPPISFDAELEEKAFQAELKKLAAKQIHIEAKVDLDSALAEAKLAILEAQTNKVAKSAKNAAPKIGLMGLALAAIGSVGVPAVVAVGAGVVALTTSVTALAAGVGVAVLAFQGIGDAVKALNDSTLSAEKLQEVMDKLSPAGQQFAKYIASLAPELKKVKAIAQQNLLPGLTDALQRLLTPAAWKAINQFVGNIAAAMSDIARDWIGSLGGVAWQRAFHTFARLAPTVLRTIGNIGKEVGTIFAGIFTAALPPGQRLLSDFNGFLSRVSTWVNSPTGQNAMRDFFQRAIPVIESLGRLVGQVVRLFGSLSTNPGVVAFVDNMSSIVGVIASFINANPRIASSLLNTLFYSLLAYKSLTFLSKTAENIRGLTGSVTGLGGGAGKLGALGKFAGTLGIVYTGLHLLGDILPDKVAAATTSVDDFSVALANLRRTGSTGINLGALGKDFDKVGASLVKLSDPGLMERVNNASSKFNSFFGLGSADGDTDRAAVIADFKNLDQVLTNLVSSGQAQAAAELFQEINRKAIAGGAGVDQLASHLPDYTAASKLATIATDGTSSALTTAAKKVLTYKDNLKLATNAALATYDAQAALEQQFDDLPKHISKSTAALLADNTQKALGTQKGRDLYGQLRTLRSGMDQAASAAADQGKSQAGVNEAFNKGRQRIIDWLVKNGVAITDAKRLTDKFIGQKDAILKIPTEHSTTFKTPGLQTALERAQDLVASVYKLNGVRLDVDVVRRNIEVEKKREAAGRGPQKSATGGLIRGPGTGTSDSIPALLSNNEYVVKASSVKALGVHRLNYMNQHGSMPGYAHGGVVQIEGYPKVAAGVRDARNRMAAELTALAKKYAAVSVPGAPGNVSGNAAIVQQVAGSRGWGSGAQWNALYRLIMGESGFRNTAQNPSSSAYGMFQFLNGTWGGVGGSKTSDPRLQAIYGLRYIAQSYGSPLNAYGKWSSRSPHWYDQGGWLPPGRSLVENHTGKPEAILNPEQWRAVMSGNQQGKGDTYITASTANEARIAQDIRREQDRRDALLALTGY